MTGLIKVKTTLYITAETWDRLVLFIEAKYGPDTRATSITVEEAIKEFLDDRDVEAPVTA